MGLSQPPSPEQSLSPSASPSPAAAVSPSDPRVKTLHKILTRVPSPDLESALSSCGVSPLPSLVEALLPLLPPAAAGRFFRWAGRSVKHSLLAWNLMVEILGKNQSFDDMWSAIKAMRDQKGGSILSLATFESAFESYCSAGRIKEAVLTFEVMDRYGLVQDVKAVNSLLKAITRRSRCTSEAAEFLDGVKERIEPDMESFRVLLRGWEKEGNVVRAKRIFDEMVEEIGWRKENVLAYDSFLMTLIKGYDIDGAMEFLKEMKRNDCLPSEEFFGLAMDVLLKKKDLKNSTFLWETMVSEGGIVPTLQMYDAMIVLSCENDGVDRAYELLDEMPFNGLFPDSPTYEAIFDCLVRMKNPKVAEMFFLEMRKNAKIPSPSSCASAIKMFFEEFDPIAACEVWKLVREEYRVSQLEDCAKEMILGLLDLERMREVRLYVEELVDYGVVLSRPTMDELKSRFHKVGYGDFYERRLKRLRFRV